MATFLNRFTFLFLLLSASVLSQTKDTSKIVLEPLEVLSIKFFSSDREIKEDPNAIDNKRTDSLRGCEYCKNKRENFYKLKSKLKFSIDSVTKVVESLNKYEVGPYYYYLLIETDKNSSFTWGFCNDYITNDGSHLSYLSHSSHSGENIVHYNFKVVKEERFRIRLDGLIDSQTFYREDLH